MAKLMLICRVTQLEKTAVGIFQEDYASHMITNADIVVLSTLSNYYSRLYLEAIEIQSQTSKQVQIKPSQPINTVSFPVNEPIVFELRYFLIS